MKYDPVELIRSDDEIGDLIVHVCTRRVRKVKIQRS